MKGKVYLVGAGPGDPDLLTVKALRLLQTADIVLHDELVDPEILKLVSPAAQLHNVGKRCGRKSISQEAINSLLVTSASLGLQAVRLKSGDPFIFGRGGEEIEALRDANVDFEVVPGVTAALGAAAAAQIPLTHRRLSSALVFVTSHRSREADQNDWSRLVSSGATLVMYMPGYDYPEMARGLSDAGLKADTPCAIISRATTAQQQLYLTNVQNLPVAPRLPAPTLLVIGEVVGLAKRPAQHWEAPIPIAVELPSELAEQEQPA